MEKEINKIKSSEIVDTLMSVIEHASRYELLELYNNYVNEEEKLDIDIDEVNWED